MKKTKVGVTGGTGMVGQNYIRLLRDHPWFQVTYVAASPRSAGKRYAEAVSGRWLMPEPAPEQIKALVVQDANLVESAKGKCELVFSAIEADKDTVRKPEEEYAKTGIPVVSNNSAHRNTPDVPMMLPEANPGHAELIRFQREQRGWKKGLIAVKPKLQYPKLRHPTLCFDRGGLQARSRHRDNTSSGLRGRISGSCIPANDRQRHSLYQERGGEVRIGAHADSGTVSFGQNHTR